MTAYKDWTPTFAISLVNIETNHGLMDFGYSDKKTAKGAIRNNWNTIGFSVSGIVMNGNREANDPKNWVFIARPVTSKADCHYHHYDNGDFPRSLLQQLQGVEVKMTDIKW